MTDTKPSNQKAPTMTSWNGDHLPPLGVDPNILNRMQVALDTERTAHEATKAELQALREAIPADVWNAAVAALTRKDAWCRTLNNQHV